MSNANVVNLLEVKQVAEVKYYRSLFQTAQQHYIYTSGNEEDLMEDLLRIKTLKRIVTRYQEKGVLNERLVLNHLIILFNVFEPKFARGLLRHSFSDVDWVVVNTFLIFLGRSLDMVAVDRLLLEAIKQNVLKVPDDEGDNE